MAGGFDLSELHCAIDAERRRRGLTWAVLAETVGVSASTIRRYTTAADAEADGVLTMVAWLGRTPESFVVGAGAGQPLPSNRHGIVRVDMEAVAAAAGEAGGARGRTRTTIQRLVGAATVADRSIASLVVG